MPEADSDDPDTPKRSNLAKRICDAALLLDYALAKGIDIDSATNKAIRVLQRRKQFIIDSDVGLVDIANPEYEKILLKFDDAYRDLSATMKPVRADTLRATDPDCGRIYLSLGLGTLRSEAEIWSFKMWMFTGFALLFIATTEFLQELATGWYPLNSGFEMDWVYDMHLFLVGFNILLPFFYGLLGACLYLLPKCHDFVSNRSFDRLRIAEYKSRMLLGFASGGIVMYFVSQIAVGDANEAADGDEIIKLSAPVLAIIAGYNTDFIFQAIERLVAAILPKVGIASAKRAQPANPGIHKVSIQSLTDALLASENEADKVIIRSMLEAARKRL
jgi:hypothetical protein